MPSSMAPWVRGSWSRMNVCDRPGALRLLVADVAAFRNNLVKQPWAAHIRVNKLQQQGVVAMQPTRGRDREREYILRTPLFVPDDTCPVTRVAPL